MRQVPRHSDNHMPLSRNIPPTKNMRACLGESHQMQVSNDPEPFWPKSLYRSCLGRFACSPASICRHAWPTTVANLGIQRSLSLGEERHWGNAALDGPPSLSRLGTSGGSGGLLLPAPRGGLRHSRWLRRPQDDSRRCGASVTAGAPPRQPHRHQHCLTNAAVRVLGWPPGPPNHEVGMPASADVRPGM